MEKVISYILLIVAFIIVSIAGTQAMQFPDSFAKRGSLPSINEWRVSRVRAIHNH
jgi:hypothetical protein